MIHVLSDWLTFCSYFGKLYKVGRGSRCFDLFLTSQLDILIKEGYTVIICFSLSSLILSLSLVLSLFLSLFSLSHVLFFYCDLRFV